MNEFLNFKCHIEYLTKNFSKYVALFFKIRHFLPFSALLTLYKTLFQPHLHYCNIIQCNTFPTHLKKLEVLQKKVMRAISWSEFNSPTRMLFKQHNLLQLTEFNYFQNACVMYQTVHKMNLKLCELIPIFLPLHTHATRNKNLITGKKKETKMHRLQYYMPRTASSTMH